MDSPLHIGDTTTASIANHLSETHLQSVEVVATTYSGIKMIQLSVSGKAILRRVQDSYINVTQLLSLLLEAGTHTQGQIDSFIANEVLSNVQYQGQLLDHRKHDNERVRGVWVPYDKAVTIALRFDIYDSAKRLFLVDVHEYDSLPRRKHENEEGERNMGSPTKRPKREKKDDRPVAVDNPNHPYTLPVVEEVDAEVAEELKAALGAVFKRDEDAATAPWGPGEAQAAFAPILQRHGAAAVADVPLDSKGQTALHFAATLASSAVVGALIELGLASPVRGNAAGESPLVACIHVTNAMERGTFPELLQRHLSACLRVFDTRHRSVLHHLAQQAAHKPDSACFYMRKVLEHVSVHAPQLRDMAHLVDAVDNVDGNTALHIAAESGSRWMIRALLVLKADTEVANTRGVRPSDYDAVKDAMDDDDVEHVFELVRTAMEFLDERVSGDDALEEESPERPRVSVSHPSSGGAATVADAAPSSAIFQSISDLLANTNREYEAILNAKRAQVKNLNDMLRDITVVTANNRYSAAKVHERLVHLENLKLQMANLSERLDTEASEDIDVDGSYLIQPLYDRVVKGESVDDLRDNKAFIDSLRPAHELSCAVEGYKKFNDRIEQEVQRLMDYGALKAKFKKVVSICTGVDVNEIDGLLDGLLEAVSAQ